MNSILYIDCDGVIFDTIEEAYRMMDEMNLDRNNKSNVNFFFKNVDWNILFERACELNNAIEKIKLIKESNYYKDVIILTKLSGNYYEEGIKRAIFEALLPNIQVITLQFDLKKNSVVYAKNNILVDDEKRNVDSWKKANGIGIYYQQKNDNFENDVITDLLDINETYSVKKYIKTRKK